MNLATDEAEVLARFSRWASVDDRVRAALLTSTRADPGAPRDILSDYDIALIVSDVDAMVRDERWVEAFGTPLLRVRDVVQTFGLPVQSDMVLYDDGAKIDYTLWPLEVGARIAEEDALPDDFDGGYRVLLDKDGLTRDWPPPSHSAYIITKPTAADLRALVEEFWFVATYVAKYLWRDEFLPARVIFEQELKYLIVRRLLEWRAGIDSDWSVHSGFFGRELQRHLDPEMWAAFEATYTGPEREAMWAALYRTIALFRQVAAEVALGLGCDDPSDLDAPMGDYLRQIARMAEQDNALTPNPSPDSTGEGSTGDEVRPRFP